MIALLILALTSLREPAEPTRLFLPRITERRTIFDAPRPKTHLPKTIFSNDPRPRARR